MAAARDPNAAGTPPLRVVTVVGNPKPRSRTYAAAEMVVHTLTGRAPDECIDLADLGADLLDWSSPAVAAAVDLLVSADLAVVASPTYKASYTGLLKLFLDQIPGGKLSNVTVVPLMVAANPKHALAGEIHLKPVLAELGASCPTAALFLLESHCDEPAALEHWLSIARPWLPTVKRDGP